MLSVFILKKIFTKNAINSVAQTAHKLNKIYLLFFITVFLFYKYYIIHLLYYHFHFQKTNKLYTKVQGRVKSNV